MTRHNISFISSIRSAARHWLWRLVGPSIILKQDSEIGACLGQSRPCPKWADGLFLRAPYLWCRTLLQRIHFVFFVAPKLGLKLRWRLQTRSKKGELPIGLLLRWLLCVPPETRVVVCSAPFYLSSPNSVIHPCLTWLCGKGVMGTVWFLMKNELIVNQVFRITRILLFAREHGFLGLCRFPITPCSEHGFCGICTKRDPR